MVIVHIVGLGIIKYLWQNECVGGLGLKMCDRKAEMKKRKKKTLSMNKDALTSAHIENTMTQYTASLRKLSTPVSRQPMFSYVDILEQLPNTSMKIIST